MQKAAGPVSGKNLLFMLKMGGAVYDLALTLASLLVWPSSPNPSLSDME